MSDAHVCYVCPHCQAAMQDEWKQKHFESSAYRALIDESTRLRANATEHYATKIILLDLITEIQNPDTGAKPDCTECGYVGACQMHYAAEVEHAADRAEDRLKGLDDG